MTVRKRRALGLGLLVFGVLDLGLVLAASPAHAQAPDRVGWWFEAQTTALPLPVPVPVPVVPDGGLFVQQGANGPVAYGALHFTTADAASSLVELTAAAGSTTIGSTVQACRVTSSWSAPSPAPGTWESKPTYDSPCALGRVSTDGKVVVFYLDKEYVRDGAIDVAIVPPSTATPFAVAFDKPGADALTPAAAAPGSGGPTTTIQRPAVTAPPGNSGGTASAVPSRAPGISPVGRAAPAAPAAPAAAPPAAAAPPSKLANDVLNAAGFGDPDRGARAMSLLGASGLIIGWWLTTTQPERMPRLVGALATGRRGSADPPPTESAAKLWSTAGGVGRFARPRDTGPRALR
jgi:hypothetical protein